MNMRSLTKAFGVLLVMALVLTACPSPSPTPTEAPTKAVEPTPTTPPKPTDTPQPTAEAKEVVKVAYVPIMHFAPLYVAKERGFFDALGLDVQLETVKSGTEAIAFLTEGQIDVGAIAVTAGAWNAFNQGLDLRVVAPAALKLMKGDPTKLMVRKDLYDSGEVTTAADLKGRTVAMAGGPGGGGEYLVAKALEGSGLTVHDVEMVKIGNPDMAAAFETGAIDAALMGSPYVAQVMQAGTAVPLVEDMAPGAMTVVFVYSGKFMKERPEAAKRFMVGLMQGTRAMQGDEYLSDENMAAYLKYQKSTEEAIRASTPMLYDPNLNINEESLRDVERVHRENGRTDYTDPVPMENVVDYSWQRYALMILGPYQQ